MKKITLLFTIALLSSFTAMAQYAFPAIAGPNNVAAGSPVTLNINDVANAAGATAGPYTTFSVSADWSNPAGFPYSNEADLTMTTSAGAVLIDPPTSGGLASEADTTLTFDGAFAAVYDPSVDGVLDITLNQSYGGSSADWSNIVVTIFPAPSCIEPTGLSTTVTTDGTTADLSWTDEAGATSGFDWIIVDDGGDPDAGPAIDSGSTAVAVTTASAAGLTVSSIYDLYVRSNCGGAGYSTWAGPENFLAAVAPANDDCANAVSLTVNADLSCTELTAGTIAAATDSGVDNCGGTENDDVWYSFVATAVAHKVELLNITGGTTDLFHAVYDATPGCGSLAAALTCSDPNTSVTTGLTIGNTYFVQVYSWTSTAGQTSAFDICIGTPPPAPANDDCANAEAITIPVESTCTANVVATTTSATEGAEELVSCDGFGNLGIWYSFTAPANGAMEFTSGTGNPGVAIYEGVCGTLTEVSGTCINNTSGSISGLTPGAPYYAMIYTDGEEATVEFCLYSLPCAEAVGTTTVVSDCANDQFSIDVDVTDLGSSSTVVLTYNDGSGDQTTDVTATGITNIGPFANGASVAISLVHESDAACDADLGAVAYQCPPVNDDVCNAIALVMGDTSAPDAFTSIGATEQTGEVVGDCFNSGINGSTWFTFVAPVGGAVTVSSDVSGSVLDDTEIAVYEAPTDCTDASTLGAQVGCDQDGGIDVNFNSIVTMTGLTEGATYYIQVDRWGTASDGTFGIALFDNTTMSTTDFESKSLFSYYPNPVNNTLTLNAQKEMSNVSVFNMLGQEVVRTTPNAVTNEVNMSSLQAGAYFVKVTIDGVTETVRIIKN